MPYRAERSGTPLTLDEYETLTRDDERAEVTRGMLVREPRSGHEHGAIQAALATMLVEHVCTHRLGTVLTEAGFILAEEPLTLRGPDIAFVARDRYPGGKIPIGFARLPPDLAVEIVSPNDSAVGVHEKVNDYLDAGTRLVWVVYPRTRQVAVFRSRDDGILLDEHGLLDGGNVLPGFHRPVRAVFED